jgi:GMP synthase (glutamine-hydrolysing)
MDRASYVWGERREYSQWGMDRSIRSACQCGCGKPNHATRITSTHPDRPLYPRLVADPVVAVLHNLAAPFTGHAGPALRGAGVALDERRLVAGDPLPALEELDGILALGGEQSVRDIAADPLLTAEAELLREAVGRGVPVLGVCLGAQLLAHVLGGSVARLPRRLVAWTPIEPLPAAAGDPVLGSLPAGSMALHWNEDGFEPPPGAVELLRRPGGSAEAFRYGDRAWGVQFHPEVDPESLDGWYETGYQELSEAGVTEERARAADALHLPGQRALSDALFGGFAGVVAARAVPA